jgi:hypothetical protein
MADAVIKDIAVYRKSVSEDEFLDNILAEDTHDDMARLRSYITSLLDEVFFPNTSTPTQLSLDAANTLITELGIKAEWGSLDKNNDGILADTRDELTVIGKEETIKLRYVTEWEPQP